MAVNVFIDPLWIFSHENRFNGRQWGFDERQQKTNRIRFGGFDYDGVLFGSSRVAHINQHDFAANRVFNYAVSGARPAEFPGYLDYAEKRRGQPLKVVYLGLDFFNTNLKYPGTGAAPAHYIGEAERPLYPIEMLTSSATLGKSITNFKESRSGTACDCYDRHNVKMINVPTPEGLKDAMSVDINVYRNRIYGPDYEYDASIKTTLDSLRRAHPETRFVVFTTPPSARLFRVLVESGRLPDYQRWIGELVEVFGGVYDFMGINSVTANDENYSDAHHFNPQVGRLIVRRVEGGDADKIDFGVFVTASNLRQHLRNIELQSRALRTVER